MKHPMACRPRLSLNPLEAREVPAGNITATLSSAGVLSIVGDSHSNVVTLKITGADVTLTPDGTTSINGGTAGSVYTRTGVPKSLTATLGDGNDSLTTDTTADFLLTGSAGFDLGGGDDVLALSTTGKVTTGKLTVKGGEGSDNITIRGGIGDGSKISGAIQFDLGVGASAMILGGDGATFGELNVTGALGVSSDGGTGVVSLGSRDLTVGGATTLKQVNTPSFTNSTFGAISATANTANLAFANSTINGAVSVKATFASIIVGTGTTFNGNVTGKSDYQSIISLTGGSAKRNIDCLGSLSAQLGLNNTPVTGNVNAVAPVLAQVTQTNSAVTGNVTASAKSSQAIYSSLGVSSVKNLKVSGGLEARIIVGGTSLTVAGDGSFISPGYANVTFATAALSEIKGNLTVKGGSNFNSGSTLTANSFFKAAKNVTVDLGNIDGIVNLGDATAATVIGGNLSIKGGNGNEAILLKRVSVAGLTTITTGKGNDTLTIETASTFAKAFSADMGDGDDGIIIAQLTGAPAVVNFNGKTTIKAGAGNDTLSLGRAAGDANSKAAFAPGSLIDAGTGYNLFDDELGLFTNTVNLLNWTDPTP